MNHLATHQTRLLLISLTLIYGLLAMHLPPWVTLLFMAAGGWRYAVTLGRLKLPGMFLLLPIAALVIAGILLSHGSLFERDASVSLLAAMMALKLLESRGRRDAMLLVFLGYFLGITSFLYTQSLLVGAYLLVPVLALTATLISSNHPNGNLPTMLLFRRAGQMLGQSVPLMLALFLLFPRVPGPLWGVPETDHSGMTGLSDQMSPGSISALGRSDSVAFRVEFQSNMPNLSRLYWRGPVLWHYDGRTWTAGKPIPRPPQPLQTGSSPVRYTVTMEPHNRRWLFMLDLPASIPAEGVLTQDYQLLARHPVTARLRYQGSSSLGYRLDSWLSPEQRLLALQLPLFGNPQTRALGATLAGSHETDAKIVQTALRLLRGQPFRYTLTPPLLGANAVDKFLFQTRIGFCEHFAGSFVFLMRAAGIPARIVTGYQGGEINPSGHYLLVRQADAHAWTEVWIEGNGWVRIDPTAAVAPQRIESGIARALSADQAMPALMRANLHWLRQIYLHWDAVNNGWNQWVLGYDQERQIEFLARLTGQLLSLQQIILGLLFTVIGIILTLTLGLLHGGKSRDKLQASYAKFCRKLADAGVNQQSFEGPLDFGRRAAGLLPAQGPVIRHITNRYAVLRYGRTPGQAKIEAFIQLVRKFRL